MLSDGPPALATTVSGEPPAGYASLLASLPDGEFTASETWSRLAAAHHPATAPLWLAVSGDDGALLAAIPLLARRRRGLTRLESSLDGTVGGILVRPDLDEGRRRAAVAAAGRALAARIRGRTGLAALTLAGHGAASTAAQLADAGWLRQDYDSAVVDCRGGLEHVEGVLWTNNRRNERNRGLKRGCLLHDAPDPDALAAWYPLYRAEAAAWAQAPAPLEFLLALVEQTPDRVVFSHVTLDGEVVAGHFGFVSRRRLVAWQGAIRHDLARTHFLTTLLYWQDMVGACARGLEAVDFGGCVGRDSLWDFKRRCGARPEPRIQLRRRSVFGRLHGCLAAAARRLGSRA